MSESIKLLLSKYTLEFITIHTATIKQRKKAQQTTEQDITESYRHFHNNNGCRSAWACAGRRMYALALRRNSLNRGNEVASRL